MLRACIILLFAILLQPSTVHPQSDTLFEGFQNPPAEARPFMRWWWNGNAVERGEALRQLDYMKSIGVGGIEINPIAMPDGAAETSARPVEWLSPEWMEVLNATLDRAERHGMISDMIVGSGWPFGGRFLDPDEQIQGLGLARHRIEGPIRLNRAIAELIEEPATEFKPEDPIPPELLFLWLIPDGADGINDCVDLMRHVNDGQVSYDVPEGEFILYAGATQTGFRTVMFGAPGADGPVVDHFNREAVERYLNRTSDALKQALSDEFGERVRSFFCDSIELSGANWTADLPEQFERRRGYSLEPWLPFVIDSEAINVSPSLIDSIERARFDMSLTLVELYNERFVIPFHEWCNTLGAKSRYQAYGHPWLMGMVEGYLIPDIPEGDTWLFNNWLGLDDIRFAQWNKYAASGAHARGLKIIGCEAMTNTKGVFRATLEFIKQAGDLSFISGVNQFILHGFNYSPPEAGFPGWIRFGTYFNEHNPWMKHFKHWADYNARLSHVFQQTEPQTRVAILGPTSDVWSQSGLDRGAFVHTPAYIHELWQAVHQNGLSADYVNERMIAEATTDNGLLKYGEAAYEWLLVAEADRMNPLTARAIADWAEAGGKIAFIGRAPERSASFMNPEENDERTRIAINDALSLPDAAVEVVAAPKRDDITHWMSELIQRFDIEPDVLIAPADTRLFQIHHHDGEREIYFFANMRQRDSIEFSAAFPFKNKFPWRWDAERGERNAYPYDETLNRLDITLAPLESLLLVFEPGQHGDTPAPPEVESEPLIELSGPWSLTLKPVEGETRRIELDSLVDLSQHEDAASFGGDALYEIEFHSPKAGLMRLDLGLAHDTLETRLNGEELGARWWGRRQYDVNVKEGINTLEISVFTTLFNYCKSLDDNPSAAIWVERNRSQAPQPVGLAGQVSLYELNE